MSDAIIQGGLLFLSGRAAVDPSSGAVRAPDFDGQCRIVLDDAFAVLREAGSDPAQVVRVECWLARRDDFTAWNAHFASAFPVPRPARTTLVADFPLADLLIEVQLTAAVGI